MQRTLVLLSLAFLPLAGCLANDPVPGATTDDAAIALPVLAPLPANIKDAKEVQAGVDVFNFVPMQGICSQDVSACYEYPFTITADQLSAETTLEFVARLQWSGQFHDFDLHLKKGADFIATDGATPPAYRASLFYTIMEPGDYALIVVAWLVTDDYFTVTGDFERYLTPPNLPATVADGQSVDAARELGGPAGGFCKAPTSKCFTYPIQVDASHLEEGTRLMFWARAQWFVQANDFDIYLFKGEERVAYDSGSLPGYRAAFTTEIMEAGDYSLVVVPYQAVGDSFQLATEFYRVGANL